MKYGCTLQAGLLFHLRRTSGDRIRTEHVMPKTAKTNEAPVIDPSFGNVQSIEFWFDFASTYSYVAALRVETLCEVAGLKVDWNPLLLGPLFPQQLGIRDSPFNAFPVRGQY